MAPLGEKVNIPNNTGAKANQPKAPGRSFLDSVLTTSKLPTAKTTEIELYLSHAYPTDDSDGALKWWAVSNRIRISFEAVLT